MRSCTTLATALVFSVTVACATAPAAAQSTLDWPVGQLQKYTLDTGLLDNANPETRAVFAGAVHVENAAWLRIYFGETALAPGSFIRITSLMDFEVQELDADELQMWSNSSAYFNGDMLLVELIAAPDSRDNRFTITQVAREILPHQPLGAPGQCGICGSDDRVPSNEDWSGRLLPAGCTASVWNMESCLVSAGHCIAGGDIIQFRVPNSNGNCSINHPPVADQFPVLNSVFVNGGVGNDWAVMKSGTNNLGQRPFDRYGVFRPIASTPASVGQPANIWGFGVDLTCSRSQTQQTSGGSIQQVFSTFYTYSVDVRGGNSGSGLIRNGEIVGIVTHCPCPNVATRVDLPAFANARENSCPDVGQPEEATLTNFQVKKGIHTGGNLFSLENSDNLYLTVLSDGDPTEKANVLVFADSPFDTVSRLDLRVETGIDNIATAKTSIYLRNFVTNKWVLLEKFTQPLQDTVKLYNNVANPNDYISPTGEIRVRVFTKKRNVPPFTLRIDHVEITLTP